MYRFFRYWFFQIQVFQIQVFQIQVFQIIDTCFLVSGFSVTGLCFICLFYFLFVLFLFIYIYIYIYLFIVSCFFSVPFIGFPITFQNAKKNWREFPLGSPSPCGRAGLAPCRQCTFSCVFWLASLSLNSKTQNPNFSKIFP